MKPLHIFIHVPRTGGKTFIEEILKKNDLKVMRFPRRHHLNWSGVDAIYGHFKFDLADTFDRFKNRKKYYFTFLRQPIDRTISYYHHCHIGRKGILPWNEWIETNTKNPLAFNSMVHYLGGGDKSKALENMLRINFYVGFTHEYDLSLKYVKDKFLCRFYT